MTELLYSLSPHKPYDDNIWNRFTLYDNMPYVWDADSVRQLKLVSGNVIKGYRCRMKESYEIKH